MEEDRDELQSDEALASHVWRLIEACEQYADEQKPDRERALEYYDGLMSDFPKIEGRSGVVSQDIRAAIKKIMPSIMRALLSNDKVVEFEPVGQEDEQAADQATHYINRVVIPECGAEDAIHDAIQDALLVKTGILKWCAYQQEEKEPYTLEGRTLDDLAALEGDPSVEIVSAQPSPNAMVDETGQPDAYDVQVEVTRMGSDIRLEAVPRGLFLIFPGAQSIEDSPIVGERMTLTRSDLVSRGYDREVVAGLSERSQSRQDDDDRWARTGDDWTDEMSALSHAMEEVEVYEVYVHLDMDDDGIAEIHKVCIAEGGEHSAGHHQILAMEQVAEVPYAEVVIERTAHEFEGRSLAEDLIEVQRIKTSLLRETLDNLYWQNRLQAAINPSKLTADGIEAVMNPEFGKPIILAPGAQSIAEAVQWNPVPFVAQQSFGMLEYMDAMAQDRTGVTDQSGGLDPEAFRNMSATSAQIINETGIAQAEMMIRRIARGGLKKAFRGLLRLVVAHSDKPRTLRLRNQWVTYQPDSWNANMDCVVNVGLGAGSRAQDLQVLQMILALQEKLLASIGADNPYVKPDQLYNVLAKIVETSGLPSAEPYFTEPDPAEIQAKLAESKTPSIEQQKMQMEAQLEQVKAQSRTQVEQAQMQADMQVKSMEARFKAETEAEKARAALQIAEMKAEVELTKHRETLEFKYADAALKSASAPTGPVRQGDLYRG